MSQTDEKGFVPQAGDVVPAGIFEPSETAQLTEVESVSAPEQLVPASDAMGEGGTGVQTSTEAKETEVVAVKLARPMTKFLLSSYYAESMAKIQKDFELTDDERILISDLERYVFGEGMSIQAFLLALEDELVRIPDDRRDTLYARLLAEHFVPLGDFLQPTAVEVARAEELKLPPAPYYRIYVKPLTYSGAASEVAEYIAQPLLPASVKERLRELIMQKKSDRRTDAQLRETMMRSVEFGGLGFNTQTTEMALVAIRDLLERVDVMTEQEYTVWLNEQAQIAAKQPKGDEDRPASAVPLTDEHVQIRTQLDEAVAAFFQRSSFRAPDDYLGRRMRTIVSSRFRGMRSPLDVKQLLMRDTKVGGMGLAQETADQLVQEIEKIHQEFHGRIEQEEKMKIERQLVEQQDKVKERQAREAEEHARWYEEKVKGRLAPAAAVHPVIQKEQKQEQKRLGPLVEAVQMGPSSAASPVVKMSPASLAANTPSGPQPARPPVMDIMPPPPGAPRLVSLVGELKMMTLAEFRRLGSTPDEAAKKIADKLEALGKESFERRLEGVQALKASGLQASYVALVMESFRSGKPIAALAAEKRAAGQDTLSAEEVAAMIALNNALQF